MHWERYREKVKEIGNTLKSKNNFTIQDLKDFLQKTDDEHELEQEKAHSGEFKFNCP